MGGIPSSLVRSQREEIVVVPAVETKRRNSRKARNVPHASSVAAMNQRATETILLINGTDRSSSPAIRVQ